MTTAIPLSFNFIQNYTIVLVRTLCVMFTNLQRDVFATPQLPEYPQNMQYYSRNVSIMYIRTSYGSLNRTGGQSSACHHRGPSSIPRRFIWELWCKKRHWEEFSSGYLNFPGTAVAQWLRCCATNRKVAGSIPDSVSGFFIDIKSFRSHYGPGVNSASNRNEYQEYFLGVKSGRCVRLTTYNHPVLLSRNLGA